MTTIAYRNGILAADTLSTSGNLRDSFKTVKIHKVGPLLIAGAGSASRCCAFVDWVKAGMEGNSPWHDKGEGNSIVIMPDDRIVVWGESGSWLVHADFYALGSGEQLALGAMCHGASAIEAIQCAMRYDIYTGGEVVTLTR